MTCEWRLGQEKPAFDGWCKKWMNDDAGKGETGQGEGSFK